MMSAPTAACAGFLTLTARTLPRQFRGQSVGHRLTPQAEAVGSAFRIDADHKGEWRVMPSMQARPWLHPTAPVYDLVGVSAAVVPFRPGQPAGAVVRVFHTEGSRHSGQCLGLRPRVSGR